MRRSLFYIVVAALQAVGSIGSPLLVARKVGPAELGVIAVCLLVIVLVRAVASLGLYGPVSIALHDGDDGIRRARRLLRWSGLYCLPSAAVIIAAGFLTTASLSAYLLGVGAGFASAIALSHQALHRSIPNGPAYAMAVLGPTALANVAALVFTLLWGGSARAYIGSMAVVTLMVSAFLQGRYVWGAGRAIRSELFHALRVGSALIVSAAATVGLSLGDRPLIQSWLGEAAAGRYHVTYILAAGGIPLLGAVNNAWLPAVMQAPMDQRMMALRATTAHVLRGVLVLTVGAAVATPSLVKLIAGAEYIGPHTQLLAATIAVAVVPYAAYSGMCIGLLSTESTKAIALATCLGLVTNLAANVLLLASLGIVGAGVASILGYSVAALVAWWCLGVDRHLRWVDRPLIAWSLGVLVIVTMTTSMSVPDGWMAFLPVVLGGSIGLVGCLLVAQATSTQFTPADGTHEEHP